MSKLISFSQFVSEMKARLALTPERTETMNRSLKEKLATLDPTRRAAIKGQADRLHEEYLKQKQLPHQ